MQFKVRDVEPAQEDLAGFIGVALGFFIIFGVTACVRKIEEWRDSKRSPEEKLKRALNKIGTDTQWIEPGNYDEFPTNFGRSYDEADKAYGGHWGPRKDKADPKLTTSAYPYAEFTKWLDKLSKVTTTIAGMGDTERTMDKLNGVLKSNFSKKDFVYENDKPADIIMKQVTAKWPEFEFYVKPDNILKNVHDRFKALKPMYKKIANNIGQIIRASTEDASEEEMQNRVAYVKAAEMILFLNNAIIEKLHMNFDYLCEIDVEWFDYESE